MTHTHVRTHTHTLADYDCSRNWVCLLFIPNAHCSGAFMEREREREREGERERERESNSVSNSVFYAQSTITVISGHREKEFAFVYNIYMYI